MRQLAGDVVWLGARDPAAGEAAAAAMTGDVRVVQLDVTDAASVRRAAQAVEQGSGVLDVLVGNVAVHYDTWQRAVNADLKVVREALAVNLVGVWEVVQAFLPLLRGSRHGRVVNVSSGAGSLAGMGSGTPACAVSKAALNALTRNLALTCAARGSS